MVAGVFEFVARGNKDGFLIGNPNVQFFRQVFRMAIPHMREYVHARLLTDEQWGRYMDFQIEPHADWVRDFSLSVAIPALVSPGSATSPTQADAMARRWEFRMLPNTHQPVAGWPATIADISGVAGADVALAGAVVWRNRIGLHWFKRIQVLAEDIPIWEIQENALEQWIRWTTTAETQSAQHRRIGHTTRPVQRLDPCRALQQTVLTVPIPWITASAFLPLYKIRGQKLILRVEPRPLAELLEFVPAVAGATTPAPPPSACPALLQTHTLWGRPSPTEPWQRMSYIYPQAPRANIRMEAIHLPRQIREELANHDDELLVDEFLPFKYDMPLDFLASGGRHRYSFKTAAFAKAILWRFSDVVGAGAVDTEVVLDGQSLRPSPEIASEWFFRSLPAIEGGYMSAPEWFEHWFIVLSPVSSASPTSPATFVSKMSETRTSLGGFPLGSVENITIYVDWRRTSPPTQSTQPIELYGYVYAQNLIKIDSASGRLRKMFLVHT